MVSRSAMLRCGSTKLDWTTFCFGFLFAINADFLSYQTNTLQHPLAYQHIIPLIVTYICSAEATYQDLDLLSLLQNHRLFDATDPKDNVYALIGLSTKVESQVHGLILEYPLPTAEVYTEASKAIISKSMTLDILGVPRTASKSRHWQCSFLSYRLERLSSRQLALFEELARRLCIRIPHDKRATFHRKLLFEDSSSS